MQTAAEIIASAEEFFDRDALELQIDYCKTILKAAIREYSRNSQADPEGSANSESQGDAAKSGSTKPQPPGPKPARRARISLAQTNLCHQNLSYLTEALRLQKLLVQSAVNKALGADSPFADSPLPEHNGDLYGDYCDRRLLLKPARAKARAGSGPDTPTPFPPRPRSQVDNYFNALEGPARSPSNGNGSSRNAKQSRNNELGGGATTQQEAAPALSLAKGDIRPDAANAQAVEQWGEQANRWLNAGEIGKPMPTLAPQVEEWLQQQAQHDPRASRWMLLLNEMKKIDHLMQIKAGAGGARQTVQV